MDTTPQIRKQLSFTGAIEEAMIGKKITRLEWQTENVYGIVKDDILQIYRDDKHMHWIVSLADMRATDWVVIK